MPLYSCPKWKNLGTLLYIRRGRTLQCGKALIEVARAFADGVLQFFVSLAIQPCCGFAACSSPNPERNHRALWRLSGGRSPAGGSGHSARSRLRSCRHGSDPSERLRSLRRVLGLETVYPKPKTSIPFIGHTIDPYLLRNYAITEANEVWGITYIREVRDALTRYFRHYNTWWPHQSAEFRTPH